MITEGPFEAMGVIGALSGLIGKATEGHLGQLCTERKSQQQSDKHVEARELKLLVLKNKGVPILENIFHFDFS